MENFLARTISEESKEYNIKVHRTRTSKGFSSISVTYNSQKIEFTNDSRNENPTYEQEALELSELLQKIALNPCELPKMENTN